MKRTAVAHACFCINIYSLSLNVCTFVIGKELSSERLSHPLDHQYKERQADKLCVQKHTCPFTRVGVFISLEPTTCHLTPPQTPAAPCLSIVHRDRFLGRNSLVVSYRNFDDTASWTTRTSTLHFPSFAQREPHSFHEMYVSAPNPSFPPRHRARSHTSTMPLPTRTPKLNA
jgi:hypothetical protein